MGVKEADDNRLPEQQAAVMIQVRCCGCVLPPLARVIVAAVSRHLPIACSSTVAVTCLAVLIFGAATPSADALVHTRLQ